MSMIDQIKEQNNDQIGIKKLIKNNGQEKMNQNHNVSVDQIESDLQQLKNMKCLNQSIINQQFYDNLKSIFAFRDNLINLKKMFLWDAKKLDDLFEQIWPIFTYFYNDIELMFDIDQNENNKSKIFRKSTRVNKLYISQTQIGSSKKIILYAREITKWLCSISRKPPNFESEQQTEFNEQIDEIFYSANNFMGIKMNVENITKLGEEQDHDQVKDLKHQIQTQEKKNEFFSRQLHEMPNSFFYLKSEIIKNYLKSYSFHHYTDLIEKLQIITDQDQLRKSMGKVEFMDGKTVEINGCFFINKFDEGSELQLLQKSIVSRIAYKYWIIRNMLCNLIEQLQLIQKILTQLYEENNKKFDEFMNNLLEMCDGKEIVVQIMKTNYYAEGSSVEQSVEDQCTGLFLNEKKFNKEQFKANVCNLLNQNKIVQEILGMQRGLKPVIECFKAITKQGLVDRVCAVGDSSANHTRFISEQLRYMNGLVDPEVEIICQYKQAMKNEIYDQKQYFDKRKISWVNDSQSTKAQKVQFYECNFCEKQFPFFLLRILNSNLLNQFNQITRKSKTYLKTLTETDQNDQKKNKNEKQISNIEIKNMCLLCYDDIRIKQQVCPRGLIEQKIIKNISNNNHIFCKHQNKCLKCDSCFQVCHQCKIAKGDGEVVRSILQDLNWNAHLFIDFDLTLCTTKCGANPLALSSKNKKNDQNIETDKGHQLDELLSNVIDDFISEKNSRSVSILTRNSHQDSIERFLQIKKGDIWKKNVKVISTQRGKHKKQENLIQHIANYQHLIQQEKSSNHVAIFVDDDINELNHMDMNQISNQQVNHIIPSVYRVLFMRD